MNLATTPDNRITVVIISYRYGHLVSQAIGSVLSQTLKPDRLIVVDDAAGDCKHIRSLYPEVEFYQNPVNLGIVGNKNFVMNKLVTTEKMLILGADNWLRPDAIEKMYGQGTDIASSWINICGERMHNGPYSEDIKFENGYYVWKPPAPHGCSLYNVKLAREVGGYQPSGHAKSEEDSVMFNRMLEAGASQGNVQEPLLFYRRHRHNFQPW